MAADPVVTDFNEGLSWFAGGSYVPTPPGQLDPPIETRPVQLAVAVVEGGDVHLRLVLPGAPSVPIGDAMIPQAMLADVVAAMQQAAPAAAEAEQAQAS